MAKHKVNIMGQYLKTNEEIGYVITDVDKTYHDDLKKELKSIKNTIKFRVLYWSTYFIGRYGVVNRTALESYEEAGSRETGECWVTRKGINFFEGFYVA